MAGALPRDAALHGRLARLEGPPDTVESYERYKEWLPFGYRNRTFFEVSARDLGYELHELDYSPGERLF